MSPGAPAARWARDVEGWRAARLVPDGPWGTPCPRVGRRCQVGGLGCQWAGLEERELQRYSLGVQSINTIYLRLYLVR